MSRVELAKITSLTFYKDTWTQGRRTEPIPQLICKGSPCKLFQPEAVRCVNAGGSGIDIDWKCEADLPESLRFGRVEVSCEGWSKPGDPYVLKGSCSLEYRLVQVPDALRTGSTDSPLHRLKGYNLGDTIFYALWLGFVALILYNMAKSCLRRNNFGSQGSGPRPGGGGGGSGGGGGGGGWFPGDHRDDWGNPPPYTKYPSETTSSAGWRPGFWTGAAVGGLASQLWNTRRQSDPRVAYRNEVPIQRSPMFGGFHSTPRQQQRFDDDDRGEGTSNLGRMRRSTGLGSSHVR